MKEALRKRLLQIFENEYRDHIDQIRDVLNQARKELPDVNMINEVFRRVHSLKGAARAVELSELEQLFHQLEDILTEFREHKRTWDQELQTHIENTLEMSDSWLIAHQAQQERPNIPECVAPLSVSHTPSTNTPELGASMRLSTHHLEQLLSHSENLLVGLQLSDNIHTQYQQLQTQLQELHQKIGPSLRESLRPVSQALRSIQIQHKHVLWSLTQEREALQSTLRNIGTIPAKELFQSFPKMLHELAKEHHKKINVHFEGLEIEADRGLLIQLKDPITHILRNAIAHGIESPAERVKQGKPENGNIYCQLTVKGAFLGIRIWDDGRGLQQKKITAHPSSLSSSLPWKERIFEPGFSTAESIDHLHGRGMGLSAVVESITRLQGQYRLLNQTLGFGIELTVPLQIATYHLLIVSEGKQLFAIPSSLIIQLRQGELSELQYVGKNVYLRQPDGRWPFLTLSQLLFASSQPPSPHFHFLLVRHRQENIALAVGEFQNITQQWVKPFTGPAQQLNGYLGAIQNATGKAIPVLDLPTLLVNASHSSSLIQHQEKSAPLILVVDDSITTRTLEKGILESEGFHVELAMNGREALMKLQENSFDLLITDVQMPEMDGLELVAAVKRDPALARIPIIMVTSLHAESDQKRGLELGADAYLVKQDFDQQELLEVIAQLL